MFFQVWYTDFILEKSCKLWRRQSNQKMDKRYEEVIKGRGRKSMMLNHISDEDVEEKGDK